MLDFRISTFLTLSKTLNYTQTGKQLCMTQPAVTQHIKYLENYYDVKLFTHEYKHLQLTKAGKILQRYMTSMAADEKKIKDLIHHSQDELQHMHFGATRTIGEFILPNKLSHVIQAHPHTSMKMIVDNTCNLLTNLKAGEIDFAFVEGYFKKDEVHHQRLSKERFIAVKATTYQLQHEVHTLADLLTETLVIREFGSGTREILERVLCENNMTIHHFHNMIEIGNIHAIKDLVRQNHGITFLYEAAVIEELQEGVFEIIDLRDFKIQREFNFITLPNSIFSNYYEMFFDEIRKG